MEIVVTRRKRKIDSIDYDISLHVYMLFCLVLGLFVAPVFTVGAVFELYVSDYAVLFVY